MVGEERDQSIAYDMFDLERGNSREISRCGRETLSERLIDVVAIALAIFLGGVDRCGRAKTQDHRATKRPKSPLVVLLRLAPELKAGATISRSRG